jgi:starch phosphorylase
MVNFVRNRLKMSALARGVSESDTAWCDEVLDHRFLTLGFARRFAAYKRATLLLSQPERLEALLLSTDHPVQLVFAGKAHPADEVGKEMIRQIVQFSRRPLVRHRIVFVEDYDIAVARALYQGADVWLNTPRRPLEACGTSGEKAALNGALNCSILDGWWDEMFNAENGWAISSAEGYDDLARRDEVEAASLFDILETQIVPLFYEQRDESGVPRRWVGRVRSSLSSLGWQVSASRMLQDYVAELYEPTAARADALGEGDFARARALAEWKNRVLAGWDGVEVDSVDAAGVVTKLGEEQRVEAVIGLGRLSSDDVAVLLLHGPVGPTGELHSPSQSPMAFVADDRPGYYRFKGSFTCEHAGRYGLTVRVVPAHADLATFAELGCVTDA